MEERTKLKIKENDLVQLDNTEEKEIPIEPYRTNCEYCGKNITTCVRKEFNLTIFPYSIIIFYFYGLLFGAIIFTITFLL
jgi:hypothetical protein